MKKILNFILFAIMVFLFNINVCADNDKKYNIVIDPGHGANYSYTTFTANDDEYTEYELNYKIAKYLKRILKNYKEFNVYMTKNKLDSTPTLEERVNYAKKIYNKNHLPTFLVSLHNNVRTDGKAVVSDSDSPKNEKGFLIIAPSGNYRKNVANKAIALGKSISNELENLGIHKNYEDTDGIYYRYGTARYPNGSKIDYYGIVRNGIYKNIPSIIVEHAYMTNLNDYIKFLSSDEKLYKLALADAKGILNYFNVSEKTIYYFD